MIVHCTAHPAPYWKFEDQEFVWDYKDEYLYLLKNWLNKINEANKITQHFSADILNKILFEEIYLNIENKFNNMIKPKNFKMKWLP